MVNRLEEMRKEKDRAEEEYSEAIRDTVRALRKENPMWTIKKIADTVNLPTGTPTASATEAARGQGIERGRVEVWVLRYHIREVRTDTPGTPG